MLVFQEYSRYFHLQKKKTRLLIQIQYYRLDRNEIEFVFKTGKTKEKINLRQVPKNSERKQEDMQTN